VNPLHIWGAAGTAVFAVLIGLFYQTHHLDKRLDDLRDSLRNEMIARIDGLEKRLVDRIERLEHPLVK
jgi:hypothetical protein